MENTLVASAHSRSVKWNAFDHVVAKERSDFRASEDWVYLCIQGTKTKLSVACSKRLHGVVGKTFDLQFLSEDIKIDLRFGESSR